MSHLLVFRVGIVECKDRRSNATAIVSFRRDVEFNAWGSSESVGGLLNQNICMSRKQVVGALNLARYIYHRCSLSHSLVSEETRVSPDISTGVCQCRQRPSANGRSGSNLVQVSGLYPPVQSRCLCRRVNYSCRDFVADSRSNFYGTRKASQRGSPEASPWADS